MLYRKNFQRTRRNPYKNYQKENIIEIPEIESCISDELKSIPLPNEDVNIPRHKHSLNSKKNSSILDLISKHIGLEEIILLGTIFLLMQESGGDEILLIVLVYVLIT